MTTVSDADLYNLFPPHRRTLISDEEIERVRAAIELMKSYDPVETEFVLAELMIQHVAFLVNDKNEFENNWNIADNRRELFSEHISWMKDSSIEVWTKRFAQYAFWRFSNPVICNLVGNWLNGSLDKPRGFTS